MTEEERWTPLSARSDPERSKAYDALHEGIPGWVERPLLEWVRKKLSPGYGRDLSEENVRQSPAYQVRTPEGALALAEELGDNSVFYLNPLLAGVDPTFSWEMLQLFEREVHPHLKRG